MSKSTLHRYLRFWGSDRRADTDDELRFHIETAVQELVTAGMAPEQARAEAMRRFGDVDRVRASCDAIDRLAERDRRRRDLWETVMQDLRYAARSLRRSPGFALGAVLTLALGIGANTAIFSVVDGVLLRPLPYHDPSRLARLFTAFRGSGTERYAMSQPEFMDYKGLTQVFENASAYTGASLTLTSQCGAPGERCEPQRVRAVAATRDLLPVLGILPARGRNFENDEGRGGTERVVILTHELWQNRLGGDPRLLGGTLTLNGVPRRVVGILSPGFQFEKAEALVPIYVNPDSMTGRSSNYLDGVARLRSGVTLEQAQRELNAVTRRTAVQYPRNYPASMGYGATVVGLRDEMVGDVRPALLVLLGAVGLVLLIACANVANLLLARGEARQREIAVRTALGADRRRIVRQLLTESVLLSVAGAAAGALLAWWGVKTMLAVNPTAIPRLHEIRVDATVGAVTLAVALFTGLVFGLAPSMQLARAGVHASLREGARGGSESAGRYRLGRTLVVTEIALAVVVVIGAGLLIRSFWALRTTDPGFVPERLLVVDLDVPEARYDAQATGVFYRDLVQRLAALPGAQSSAAASDLPPVASGSNWDIAIEGRTRATDETAPSPNVRSVTGEYFRTMSISIVRGRALVPADEESALSVAVLNETAARSFWPGSDPIGQRVRFSSTRSWITIVGIARDVKSAGLGEPTPPEIFVPHGQLPAVSGTMERTMYAVVRTAGDPALIATAARHVVRDLDPQLAIRNVWTMREMIGRSVAAPRFTMLLLSIFAAVALSLAAIGIYGILSYAVRRRTREIGIRVALGGQPRHVLWLVVGQGLRLAMAGLTLGVLAALAATRLTTRLLYGVRATDPFTFAGVVILLGAVAFLASWLPARRAVSVDPRAALSAD